MPSKAHPNGPEPLYDRGPERMPRNPAVNLHHPYYYPNCSGSFGFVRVSL
jgi:hypothetical protein